MSKKTAVEWLFTMLNNPNSDQVFAKKLLDKAKEMEKEQIMNAFWNGDNTDCISEQNYALEYYKQNFK